MGDIRSSPIKAKSYKVLTGHTHSNDKNLLKCNWSPDGLYVSAGSGDKTVCIWNVETRRLFCKLPGHTDSVNEVVFHPTEPIIGSCSSDRQIHIGELANTYDLNKLPSNFEVKLVCDSLIYKTVD